MQAITAGVLASSADLIAQRISSKSAPIDNKSILFQGLIAAGYRVPLIQIWLQLLEPIGTVWKKVALDQLVFAPCLIFGYLAINAVNNGKSLAQFSKEVRYSFVKILLSNYKLWPLVSWINFTYVPMNYRVLVATIVGFFWTIYLILSTKEQKKKD
jgi:hypothetical protein